ncbi:MAG: CoA-binding protein [Gallionellaceae bacterium]
MRLKDAIVRIMTFANPSPAEICRVLRSVRTIAVVGLSPNPERPSFRVASAMQSHGFHIVPVRPRQGGAQPSGAGVAASHLLPQRKDGSEAAGNPPAYSLRVQSAGYAITSDLASVVGSPSRVASSSISNVSKVRPRIREVLGEPAYENLESVPFVVDIVDVFRAPEHVPAIVESCIRLGVSRLWLQDGVIHEAAAQRARDAGITVVMNRCIWRDYSQLCTP